MVPGVVGSSERRHFSQNCKQIASFGRLNVMLGARRAYFNLRAIFSHRPALISSIHIDSVRIPRGIYIQSRKSEIDHRALAITSHRRSIDCAYESNSKPHDATSLMETTVVTLCSHVELKRFRKFSQRAVLMNIRIEFPIQVGEKISASRVGLLCHLHGLRSFEWVS